MKLANKLNQLESHFKRIN